MILTFVRTLERDRERDRPCAAAPNPKNDILGCFCYYERTISRMGLGPGKITGLKTEFVYKCDFNPGDGRSGAACRIEPSSCLMFYNTVVCPWAR